MFITIEGGEGAGKTTLIKCLAAHLRKEGKEVVMTREPGGTPLSETLRTVILDDTHTVGPLAELLLFLAARAQHIEEVIKPALDHGAVVLCDRFSDSTVAYQGAGRRLGVPYVRALCDAIERDAVPSLTFYLDVPPDMGLKRAGLTDRIEKEKEGFHERVQSAFMQIERQNPNRFKRIDATKPKELVFKEVVNILHER